MRRQSCAAAHLQYAELLVTMGRTQDAMGAYHEAEAVLAKNEAAAARACYAVAELYGVSGDTKKRYEYLWKTVTNYPNEGFAADAMKRMLRDGRKRAPRQLRDELQVLSGSLAHTQVSDNILEALAQLEESEFKSPKTALHYYDMLVRAHPNSGFFDDALWHGARLSRNLGDGRGAAKRLRKLLSTRVVAIGAGSYFSVWLDNAQFELGLVLRDDLKDFDGAISAFARLPSDYPASLLRDDALFERAATKARAGRQESACKDLSKLRRKYPDSKYEFELAPKLRTELGCVL
ncbi:MAG: tetratricopeptide repeat protein [Myxococcales bacterium]|nr:tetratricopeptide repeat protein [Myxococcales bacterium]